MENNKLEKLAWYLPYGLGIEILNYKCDYVGIQYSKVNGHYYLGSELHLTYEGGSTGKSLKSCKPILRPLSDMTKEINYGLSSYIFIELFEIGDTDGFIYEFDNGNIKLIQLLESISNNNSFYDINYLPYPVVQMMYQYHYDIHGLIESGEAIDINTL